MTFMVWIECRVSGHSLILVRSLPCNYHIVSSLLWSPYSLARLSSFLEQEFRLFSLFIRMPGTVSITCIWYLKNKEMNGTEGTPLLGVYQAT